MYSPYTVLLRKNVCDNILFRHELRNSDVTYEWKVSLWWNKREIYLHS